VRYAVTVDPVTAEFTVPAALGTILRVGEALPDTVHNPAGVLITNDSDAFVMQSSTILVTLPIAPRRYKIVGYVPAVVDIMGKLADKVYSVNSELVPIDYLPPLKNMCRAILLEEIANDPQQFELCQVLEQRAFQSIAQWTESAVSEARRILFTQVLNFAPKGTLGYARAHMALELTGGLRSDDHKIVALINSAQDQILSKVLYWEEALFKVKSGLLSLPAEYDKIIALTLNNIPQTIKANWYSYQRNGLGYQERGNNLSGNAIYLGTNALHTDLTKPSRLTFVTFGNEVNLQVVIHGRNEQNESITEYLTLGDRTRSTTVNTFSAVDSITKHISAGAVSVIDSDGFEVAWMQYYDQSSEVSRYQISDCNKDCAKDYWIRVVAKKKFRPQFRDSDILFVDSLQGLTTMCQAIWAGRAGGEGSAETAVVLSRQAISMIEDEKLLGATGQQVQINVTRRPGRISWGR
jgi:hypothetical protein